MNKSHNAKKNRRNRPGGKNDINYNYSHSNIKTDEFHNQNHRYDSSQFSFEGYYPQDNNSYMYQQSIPMTYPATTNIIIECAKCASVQNDDGKYLELQDQIKTMAKEMSLMNLNIESLNEQIDSLSTKVRGNVILQNKSDPKKKNPPVINPKNIDFDSSVFMMPFGSSQINESDGLLGAGLSDIFDISPKIQFTAKDTDGTSSKDNMSQRGNNQSPFSTFISSMLGGITNGISLIQISLVPRNPPRILKIPVKMKWSFLIMIVMKNLTNWILKLKLSMILLGWVKNMMRQLNYK